MKGSRVSALTGEVSGEPILRPLSGTSKCSQTRTLSPTFEMDASTSPDSPSKDLDADTINAALTNDFSVSRFLRSFLYFNIMLIGSFFI